LLVSLACLFLAMAVVAAVAIGTVRPDDRARRMTQRVERYGPRRVNAVSERALARVADRWVSPLLRFGSLEEKLAERLDLAGIGRTPPEWVLFGGCGAIVVGFVLGALFGNFPAGIAAGALLAWLALRYGLTFRINRRRRAFSDQLPDVLQFVAGSLRSGFSLGQGIDAVVREGTQPSGSEFSRALAESRIGVGLEDALDTIADRMQSSDLRWTVIAIRIQREVGGNLAEVLGNTVETMRERTHLRRHVRALSAEGRLSAYILVALPILIGGWMFLSRRSYLRPLWTSGIGIGMLVTSIVLIVVGALWMRKLVKVEV
jgi:tight adherence protein B